MHRNILTLLVIAVSCVLGVENISAQKRELSEAKSLLKQNKSLDKAESLMHTVLSDPEQKNKINNYVLLADIVKKQYENTNEKLYLKQLSDTTTLFSSLQKMFSAFVQLDSIDALPDSKGRTKLKYRRKNAEYLNLLRPNLFRGCQFYFYHKKYNDAFSCIDTYLQSFNYPLFQQYDYLSTDTLRTEAAYLAVLSASHQKDYAGIEKYEHIALENKATQATLLSLLYDIYTEKGDTAKAVAYLKQGFEMHSDYPFFFPRLFDYYSQHGEMAEVEDIVMKAISRQPDNNAYKVALNILQLNQEKYDECIALGDSLLTVNDQLAEPYYNVGSAYFNKALQHYEQNKGNRNRRKKTNDHYAKALPYIERYRSLRPKFERRWAPMLYTLYLELNKGKEFEEIERIMNSASYKTGKKQ